MLDDNNFAVVATVNEDGSPHTSVVWVDRDDDALVFTTTARRRKGRNLARDPRVSVTVLDSEDPYRTIDIAGTAELLPDPDKRLPARLSLTIRGGVTAAGARGRSTVDRACRSGTDHRLRNLTLRNSTSGFPAV